MWQNKPLDRKSSESTHDIARRMVEDVERVARLSAREPDAWRTFVGDYSQLLYGVIRRVLFAEDDDAIRTVYVDVLHNLYQGKIMEFRGQSPLSAWLVVLARGAAVDFLRRRDGRDQVPGGFERLSAVEREAFKLRYIERMRIADVVGILRELGYDVDHDALVGMLDHIETAIGPRYLRNLEYRLQASMMGADSGRLLRYIVASRHNGNGSESPLDELVAKEDAQRARVEVRAMLADLSRVERLVLRLRFQRGWQAERVAKTMRLGSATEVYQITRRATRKLQRFVTRSTEER